MPILPGLPGKRSSHFRMMLHYLALSALLISASASSLADKKHNLYLMLGSGDYSEESSRPDTATLIDEEAELLILGYGYRFSEHHEVVFLAAQSEIKEVSQKTFTSTDTPSRAVPDIDLQTFSIFYKPQLRLGSATFYGLAGFTRGTITADAEGAEKERETDLSLGLGWSFSVLSGLDLQIEYVRFFGERNGDDGDGGAGGSDSRGSLKADHALNAVNFGIAVRF